MIRLEKYKEAFFEPLDSYTLDDLQSSFTADIDYCVNVRNDLTDAHKSIIAILSDDTPVGFFVLDYGKDKYNLTQNECAVLIRSFSINPAFQGKGIGTITMTKVSDFIKENMPKVNEIVLSVNVRNKDAYRVYQRSGFVDSNQQIVGEMGPQYILSKRITKA